MTGNWQVVKVIEHEPHTTPGGLRCGRYTVIIEFPKTQRALPSPKKNNTTLDG